MSEFFQDVLAGGALVTLDFDSGALDGAAHATALFECLGDILEHRRGYGQPLNDGHCLAASAFGLSPDPRYTVTAAAGSRLSTHAVRQFALALRA